MATALFSLTNTIDQIKLHPRPPISLDQPQVESLSENVAFLQEFLEAYSLRLGYSKEADPLAMRIADAAHAVEDLIESHIVDRILAGSTSQASDFYDGLQEVIEEMETLKKEAMEVKEKMGIQDKLQRSTARAAAGSFRSSSTMVGFDDDALLEIMDKLTGCPPDRQIIPIVGMGGIGKTTLARNLYAKPLIKEHFDVCAWAVVSQQYDTRGILRDVLSQVNIKGWGDLSEDLGEILYKHLSGRRYLVVMDDMWSIDAWEKIKFFFPEYYNGSRIVVTTRLSNLALQLNGSYSLEMKFLDEEQSWDLFSRTVFDREGCPSELEKTGKEIVGSCKGLPLSVVVIGGLLAKSKYTREYWEYVAENLNSVVNSEDDESCLRILYMSYKQLPVHLKSCFLYMGVFVENSWQSVFFLTKVWVAEGFVKPVSGKSLEESAEEYLKELIDRNLVLVDEEGFAKPVSGKILEESAEEYLKELIDRNLVLVNEWGSSRNIKRCYVHDLLRDLCLRETRKEGFCDVWQFSLNIQQDTNTYGRSVIPYSNLESKVSDALPSMSPARSLICTMEGVVPLFNFRLLRTLMLRYRISSFSEDMYSLDNIFQLVNVRFLLVEHSLYSEFPSSVRLLWNLQTLIVDNCDELTAPAEIWNMPRLRHVVFTGGVYLPDPPCINIDGRDDFVLENLQMIETIVNFNCDEEVVSRIPNVKELKIECIEFEEMSRYCLCNLERLHKLESFTCHSCPDSKPSGIDYLQNLTFPLSLKNLTLVVKYVYWEDMLEKIGSLPILEKFTLVYGSFKGREWKTTEGQFHSLKFLEISRSGNLEHWTTESSHFPRLEHLVLVGLRELKEIPSEIGEIPTLKSIELTICSGSAALSAEKILQEQEELHGEVTLQVRIHREVDKFEHSSYL